MAAPALRGFEPGVVEGVAHWLRHAAPGWILLLALAFALIGAWMFLRALPLRRTLRALRQSPEVAIDSDEPGLVKLRGEAVSVTPILLRDGSGTCRVDATEALVLGPTDDGPRALRAGDALVAVGVLGTADAQGQRALRRSRDGVLLLCVRRESLAVLQLMGRWWPRAGIAFLCVIVGMWMLKQHVAAYPSFGQFIERLAAQPWQGEGASMPTRSAP